LNQVKVFITNICKYKFLHLVLLFRGSPDKADVLRFGKKNDIVKIKIKNLFYSHNSINRISFKIKIKKKLN